MDSARLGSWTDPCIHAGLLHEVVLKVPVRKVLHEVLLVLEVVLPSKSSSGTRLGGAGFALFRPCASATVSSASLAAALLLGCALVLDPASQWCCVVSPCALRRSCLALVTRAVLGTFLLLWLILAKCASAIWADYTAQIQSRCPLHCLPQALGVDIVRFLDHSELPVG